jgi:cation diffusion facilitator CzcD-associated flavoprotein CzcO
MIHALFGLLISSVATPQPHTYHQYVIIGSGPGGLQLAHYLQSAGRDYIVLDKSSESTGSFSTLPRFRQLISLNKYATGRSELDFALRFDWNSLLSDESHVKPRWPGGNNNTMVADVPHGLLFRHHTKKYWPPADAMVSYLRNFSAILQLNIAPNTKVQRIRRTKRRGRTAQEFVIRTMVSGSGEVPRVVIYRCRYLLIATGLSQPNPSDVEAGECTQIAL